LKNLNHRYKKRILSILAQHLLLFGRGIINYSKETQYQTEKLITSIKNSNPTTQEVNRTISIIRQHSLIFGYGLVKNDPKIINEDKKLIQHLKNLLRETYTPGIIPRVNYLNFKRKISEKVKIRELQTTNTNPGGLPLFGKERISPTIIKNGYLILFSLPSKSKRDTKADTNKTFKLFIHVILVKEGKNVSYKGKRSIINFNGYIHTVIISDTSLLSDATDSQIETTFKIPIQPSNLLTVRTRNGFNIYITGTPHIFKKQLVSDPTQNKYAFFFPTIRTSFTPINKFLTHIIKRVANTSIAEADNISYFITKKIFSQNGIPICLT